MINNIASWCIRHHQRVLLTLVVAAFLVRLAVTLAVAGNQPIPTSDDQISYDRYARVINDGGWWSKQVSFREPGYAFLLALVYKVVGDAPLTARLVNGLLGALTCIPLFFLGRAVYGVGVGLLTATWWVFFYHSIFFGTMLLRESLLVLLFTTFWWLLVVAQRRNSLKHLLWAVTVFVAVLHTDARYLFYLPWVALLLVLSSPDWRVGLKRLGVAVVVFVALMLPWQLRNVVAYDQIVLINTRTLVVPIPGKAYPPGEPRITYNDGPHVPFDPTGKLILTGPRRVFHEFIEYNRIVRTREGRRNKARNVEPAWSHFHNAAGVLCWGILLPFAVWGAWRTFRIRDRWGWFLIVPAVAQAVLHVIKWGRPRYRFPIEGLVLVLAFAAVAILWTRATRKVSHAD